MIIGKSHAMKEVFTAMKAASASDVTVMIYGESGTGKELVASAIHLKDRQANQQRFTVLYANFHGLLMARQYT